MGDWDLEEKPLSKAFRVDIVIQKQIVLISWNLADPAEISRLKFRVKWNLRQLNFEFFLGLQLLTDARRHIFAQDTPN